MHSEVMGITAAKHNSRVLDNLQCLMHALQQLKLSGYVQVDEEDDRDAGSEDDFELGDMAGTAAAAAAAGEAEDGAGAVAGAAAGSKRQKSVRMDVAGELSCS
jgi:hypothetical protein